MKMKRLLYALMDKWLDSSSFFYGYLVHIQTLLFQVNQNFSIVHGSGVGKISANFYYSLAPSIFLTFGQGVKQ